MAGQGVRLSREVHRIFWRQIRAGVSTVEAAAAAGVSQATGIRWFREAGGMSPVELEAPSGRYLTLADREDIAVWRTQMSQGAIARRLGKATSTIGRELKRNGPPGRPGGYRAVKAQVQAEDRARRPKPSKLATHEPLHAYVVAQLTSEQRWSPEQISQRIRLDHPDDERMRISHEAIYQALYVQGKGALRRELTVCLRTGRALRKPHARVDQRGSKVKNMVMISERPAEVEDRAVLGHWEGDLITGTRNSSAIGTLVERKSRFTMLLHLPGDHSAEAVRDAMTTCIVTLPEALRRSLTWDQGVEMAQHLQLTFDTGLQVYFCDPHSPWQRGTNENTNGLLRQYFPKGSDLSVHSPEDLALVASGLNGRPRKTLNWKTPAEVLSALLSTAA